MSQKSVPKTKKIKIETQLKSLKTRSQEVFKLSIFKYISKSEFCLKVKMDFPSRHVSIYSGNKLIGKFKKTMFHGLQTKKFTCYQQ